MCRKHKSFFLPIDDGDEEVLLAIRISIIGFFSIAKYEYFRYEAREERANIKGLSRKKSFKIKTFLGKTDS